MDREGKFYGLRVAENSIPRCRRCGAEMMPWIRHQGFLEKSRYDDQYRRLREFLEKYGDQKILFLELDVGRMTPMFIQEPFWQLTYQLPFAYYISVNPNDAIMPEELDGKGTIIHEDIRKLFQDAIKVKEEQQNEQ